MREGCLTSVDSPVNHGPFGVSVPEVRMMNWLTRNDLNLLSSNAAHDEGNDEGQTHECHNDKNENAYNKLYLYED